MWLKRSKGELLFDIANVTLMALFAFICLYPFWYVMVLSFNDGRDAMRGGIFLWPREWSLENFTTLFRDERLLGSFLMSVMRTVGGMALALLVNSLYAYAISKRDLPFRKLFNWMIVIPMYFAGGIIPYYLICRWLGLVNNPLVFVIPWAIIPFHVLLLRTSMQDFPSSIEESAQLDGSGYFRIFWTMVLPLSKPALATVALLAGIMHWNDWLDGTIMVTNSRFWPMQTLLLNIIQGADIMAYFKSIGQGGLGAYVRRSAITPESLKMAMLVITVVPILMIYPLAQRYFIKGLML